MKYFNIVKIMSLAAGAFLASGCDYLDIVPEGDPTIETAFSNRVNSEKYLYTCFSYLPNPVSAFAYPALIAAGDEMWWDHDTWTDNSDPGRAIALGYQEANDPCLNYWDGERGASSLFHAIRDCNIFLENIHSPYDIEEYERVQWIAEVKFLKAYYHFFLMQLYGPIPIIRENLPVSATTEEIRLYREPVDEVTEYIVQLIDEAVPDLPMEILAPALDAGRISKAIALAVKAKVLVWAASPLFNNNPDYADFKDNRDIQLMPVGAQPDIDKWKRAATAIRNAIDTCSLARHELYRYFPGGLDNMSPEIQLNYTIRNAVTEKFNPEIVWPATRNTTELQHWLMPLLEMGNYNTRANEIGATLKIAEQYYTRNGLPINEDPDWDYDGRYTTQVAGADHKTYIKTGETTAKLNFDREPRFYASLGFDRGIFEGSGRTSEANYYYIQSRQGEISGMRSISDHLVTGYHIKKLISPTSAWSGNTTNYTMVRYSYPLIRLTDLFLLYAEALNEIDGPGNEVYQWIDTVRLRAGIPGVEESYARALPEFRNKPYEKSTLREIIKRERLIELAFEGQRFWDLRRWKDALRYYSEPVRGWNYRESSIAGYYQVTGVWQRTFNTRDYLWPLKIHSIIVNSNLEQNPGW